jgi:hypothetical protein
MGVPDPNPDLPDPYVFGPPGSGYISQRNGSGSGTEAKIEEKPCCFVTSFGLFIFEK